VERLILEEKNRDCVVEQIILATKLKPLAKRSEALPL